MTMEEQGNKKKEVKEEEEEVQMLPLTSPHTETMILRAECTAAQGPPRHGSILPHVLPHVLRGAQAFFPPNFTVTVTGTHRIHTPPNGGDQAAETLEVMGRGTMTLGNIEVKKSNEEEEAAKPNDVGKENDAGGSCS